VVDLRRRSDRPGGAASDRARRRFARRQWARRWGSLRLVLVGVGAVVLVGLAVWLVWFSRVLAVDGVDVHGTSLLSHAQVRDVAAVPEGQPLARVDLDATRARVEALVEVSSADVSRAWPDTVRIDVVERVSVALVDFNGRMRGIDAEGVVFQDYSRPPQGLPRVQSDGTPSAEARLEVAQVVAALPDDLARRVEYVEVETVDQISLALRDGRQVIWGSAEESDLKSQVAAQLLAQQQARSYDVSVPEKPVTRSTP
jgi:cell division protein FtsQ